MLPGTEPVPYTGEDYSADVYSGPTDARPPMAFAPGEEPHYEAEPAPLPWYKRPPILFGAAAAAALLAIGGLAITLTGNSGVLGSGHRDEHDLLRRPVAGAAADIRCAETVTVTGSDGQPTTTVITPPPPPPSSTHHDNDHVADHTTTHDDHHDDHHHDNHHDDNNNDDHDVAAGTDTPPQPKPPADEPPAARAARRRGIAAERQRWPGPRLKH